MIKDKDIWNKLSSRFNTSSSVKINSITADNMFIAWPVVIKFIEKYKPKKSKIKVLDFGCGTGSFCNHLKERGFDVFGIDFSKEMIKIAQKNSEKDIEYHVGSQNILKSFNNKFDIIVSIMVFQFIKNIESLTQLIFNVLTKNGIIIFAVINPVYINRCIQEKKRYKNLDKTGSIVFMEFDKDKVLKAFLRTEKEYRKQFEQADFTFLNKYYPLFPNHFDKKYNWNLPTDTPEFLIMAFRKI